MCSLPHSGPHVSTPSLHLTVVISAAKTKKHFQENTINLEMMMNNCQQIMTLAIKNRDPLATSHSRGGQGEPRINCLSVVIWMQHLAVIYVKAEKALWENIFQVQQLAAIYIIWGENRWNKYLTGLHNEMDIFIHTELSQRLCNERMASPKDLSAAL